MAIEKMLKAQKLFMKIVFEVLWFYGLRLPSMHLIKSVTLSLVLHSLVLATVVVYSLFNIKVDEQAQVVEILIAPSSLSPTKVAVADSGGRNVKGAKSRGSAAPSVKPSNLFKTYDFQSEGSNLGSSDFANRETYDIDETSVFGENDDWGFHRQVFEKVDSHLMFDSLLAQYDHFGSVYLEFQVTPEGLLLEKTLKGRAADSVLKVHAVRALRAALNEKFSESRMSISERPITFKAHFEFARLGIESLSKAKQKEFAKPVLRFHRQTVEKRVAKNIEEHLLNGGIDYDLFAAYEKWQKYNKKKMLDVGEFDPFAHYRKDPAYNL